MHIRFLGRASTHGSSISALWTQLSHTPRLRSDQSWSGTGVASCHVMRVASCHIMSHCVTLRSIMSRQLRPFVSDRAAIASHRVVLCRAAMCCIVSRAVDAARAGHTPRRRCGRSWSGSGSRIIRAPSNPPPKSDRAQVQSSNCSQALQLACQRAGQAVWQRWRLGSGQPDDDVFHHRSAGLQTSGQHRVSQAEFRCD